VLSPSSNQERTRVNSVYIQAVNHFLSAKWQKCHQLKSPPQFHTSLYGICCLRLTIWPIATLNPSLLSMQNHMTVKPHDFPVPLKYCVYLTVPKLSTGWWYRLISKPEFFIDYLVLCWPWMLFEKSNQSSLLSLFSPVVCHVSCTQLNHFNTLILSTDVKFCICRYCVVFVPWTMMVGLFLV
jgi:hypothetical protein